MLFYSRTLLPITSAHCLVSIFLAGQSQATPLQSLPFKSLLYVLIPLVSPHDLHSSTLALQSSTGWAVFLFLSHHFTFTTFFGLCAYQTHSEATTFIPYSFTHFQLQAEIFPLWEQALCKDAPDLETHFNAASSFGLKKTKTTTTTKPEKAGLVFQKDSFKVAKQNESINAESQFTKREAKVGEAVSSGLTNSL